MEKINDLELEITKHNEYLKRIKRALFILDGEEPQYKRINTNVFEYLRTNNFDMSGVSFEGVDISGLDFTGFTGVEINPEGKNMDCCILNGVTFTGSFKNSSIRRTDFTGSKGAVINVQEIKDKCIAGSKMSGVTFVGSFIGADIYKTDFTGSKGALIDPRKLYAEGLEGAKLSGVTLTECINGSIKGTDFTGSKGAIIFVKETPSFENTNLSDTVVFGDIMNVPCDGIVLGNAKIIPAGKSRFSQEETVAVKKKSIFRRR